MSTGKEVALVVVTKGFIGGHLARALTEHGVQVRGADVKPLDEWHQISADVEAHQSEGSLV